jgi:hypothetical protein
MAPESGASVPEELRGDQAQPHRSELWISCQNGFFEC